MFKTSCLLLLITTLSLVLSNPSYAGTTISANGTVATNNTSFSSGVSEDGLNYKATLKLTKSKELVFNATMQVDKADIGKKADILLVMGVEPNAPFDGGVDTQYSAYTGKGQIVPVNLYASPDVWMAELTEPYRSNITLGVKLAFNSLGKFKFDKAAMYYVFVGYRLLENGTIVYNGVPIIIDATSAGTLTGVATAPTNTGLGDQTPVIDNGTTTTTTTEPAAFAGIVAAHNVWRKKVGVPNLTWSTELAKFAQNWANTLKDKGCDMQHRPNNDYGENLYWSSGFNPTTEEVVNAWGEEVKDYNYTKNTCATGKVCGHYTQIVWKSTKKVGCGKASCGSDQIWVCNYDPPGNWVGQKPY